MIASVASGLKMDDNRRAKTMFNVHYVEWQPIWIPVPEFCSQCHDEAHVIHEFLQSVMCSDCFQEGWYLMADGMAFSGPLSNLRYASPNAA